MECASTSFAWMPLAVTNDILVRMPGTQPGAVTLELPNQCANCHFDYSYTEPGTNWMGSMMAQAARDPIFWSTLVVAAQDSVWALGNPNAADLCLRCHFPQGWLEGRSDPPNATLMTGYDYDGIHCTVCHSMMDPFAADTYAGIREGSDWTNYWDEVGTLPRTAAGVTYTSDVQVAALLKFINGQNFYTNNRPASAGYTESAGGQMFINTSNNKAKRAPFADASANHEIMYSRYHKSRYFCSTCHDVSNPVLANLGESKTNRLPSETTSAFTYCHVERTFSEFMLSAFGRQGGAPGTGQFAPGLIETSQTNNWIASCQDCHMRDGIGKGCDKNSGILRPTNSASHPKTGAPTHDMTGGNAWIPRILASTIIGSPNYNASNRSLLVTAGPLNLTLDFSQGYALNANALISAASRAEINLQRAASITNLTYNPMSGETTFRIINHTGHKLISGYPEGRRVFANIVLNANGQTLHEVNPYDDTTSTLKGLDADYSPNSPLLAANESHHDELVYEAKMSSALTGEEKTFHFALATGRYKDNRIPPIGFQHEISGTRIVDPVWHGASATNLFSADEYAGGYRNVSMILPPGATQVTVRLFYQTTSREYMEFLRDEINGTNGTLTGTGAGGDPAYIAQTDPWFSQLKAWGNTMWQLWDNNRHLPGAAPIQMATASIATSVTITSHTILASAGPKGSINPSGAVQVIRGQNAAFSITPDSHYHITDVLVDSASAGAVATYNFTNVMSDHTIESLFAENLATNDVPEWWLAAYYPESTNLNDSALSDTDVDGMMAWAEYIAGTIPTDSNSVFSIRAMDSTGMTIVWPSISGRIYSVHYSTNLITGFDVFEDAAELPATPTINTYTNTIITNVPELLFRIDVRRE